jgi:hypothetical protein
VWFLFDSHGYFEERSEVPFFSALAAVFLTGGLRFLTSISTIIWLSGPEQNTILDLVNTLGLELFVYPFFVSFIKWALISVVFYLFALWAGQRTLDFFTTLRMTGLGFTPLLFSAAIELLATTYLTSSIPPSSVFTTTHLLIGGNLGLMPAIAMAIVHIITLLWAGHIWIGGIHQLGRVSPATATGITLPVLSALLIELIILALM